MISVPVETKRVLENKHSSIPGNRMLCGGIHCRSSDTNELNRHPFNARMFCMRGDTLSVPELAVLSEAESSSCTSPLGNVCLQLPTFCVVKSKKSFALKESILGRLLSFEIECLYLEFTKEIHKSCKVSDSFREHTLIFNVGALLQIANNTPHTMQSAIAYLVPFSFFLSLRIVVSVSLIPWAKVRKKIS